MRALRSIGRPDPSCDACHGSGTVADEDGIEPPVACACHEPCPGHGAHDYHLDEDIAPGDVWRGYIARCRHCDDVSHEDVLIKRMQCEAVEDMQP